MREGLHAVRPQTPKTNPHHPTRRSGRAALPKLKSLQNLLKSHGVQVGSGGRVACARVCVMWWPTTVTTATPQPHATLGALHCRPSQVAVSKSEYPGIYSGTAPSAMWTAASKLRERFGRLNRPPKPAAGGDAPAAGGKAAPIVQPVVCVISKDNINFSQKMDVSNGGGRG